MEEQRKPGRPAEQEVYCVASLIHTSKGPMHHGDKKKLPKNEANDLRKQRLVR